MQSQRTVVGMLVWESGYSVGVKLLDDQHKEMVTYINELEAALHGIRPKPLTLAVLKGLLKLTKDHFTDEERLCDAAGYTGLSEHRSEHKELLAELNKLISQYEQGDDLSSIGVVHFMSDWVITHINDSDKKYMPALAAHGIQ